MGDMPCPFCGRSDSLGVEFVPSDYKRCRVECGYCGAAGPDVRVATIHHIEEPDRMNAYHQWNERPGIREILTTDRKSRTVDHIEDSLGMVAHPAGEGE